MSKISTFLKSKIFKKLLICGLLFLGIIILSVALKNHINFEVLTADIKSLGIWGPIFYALLYVTISGVLIPSILFKVFAGVFFGIIEGIVIITIASTISSLIKFLFARYLFRNEILKKINQNPKWQQIDQLIEKDGWKVLILLRNIPVANALFLNYICGVTKISAFEFSWASLVGRLPATTLYVYFGYLTGHTAGLTPSNLTPSIGAIDTAAGQWILWLGLISTIAFSFYAIHLSKKLYLKN